MRKVILFISLLLGTTLFFAACGKMPVVGDDGTIDKSKTEANKNETDSSQAENNSEGDTENSGTVTGGTLKIGEYILDTQLANKNPFATSGTYPNLLKVIYEPLVTYNEKLGKLEPTLATEYSWNDTKTELIFTINTTAKWQDGTAFSADDVVYTMEVLKENPAYDKFALWNKIADVTTEGDKVTFTMDKTFVALPQYLSQVLIIPKHVWEKEDAATFVNESPIGTGPFIFKNYTTGTSIELDANADYWRGAPQVDELLIIMYNTSPNCTLGLLKGEIDATFGTIAMPSIPEFKTKDYSNIDIYPGLRNFSVLMNHENELLSDVAVRKAMAMAINQSDLITKGEYNGVLPTSIGWLPDLFGENVNEEAKNSLTFDLEGAKAVLEEAGYTKGKDGVYQKDGKKLSFTYHNASGAPAQQMEAGLIQQWLLNLGIEIIPKLATWPELTELAQTGNYDLLQNGVDFPPDPYAAINSCFNSSMTAPIGEVTPGLNYFRYRSAEMDALLEKASTETDEVKLKELYYEMQTILANDYVFLPMYNGSGHVPYYDGKNFTGWTDYEAPITSNMNLVNLRPVQ